MSEHPWLAQFGKAKEVEVHEVQSSFTLPSITVQYRKKQSSWTRTLFFDYTPDPEKNWMEVVAVEGDQHKRLPGLGMRIDEVFDWSKMGLHRYVEVPGNGFVSNLNQNHRIRVKAHLFGTRTSDVNKI